MTGKMEGDHVGVVERGRQGISISTPQMEIKTG